MGSGFTIPKKCKIEGVAAKENTRYATTGVKIDAERKSLIATDGRILLELPVADISGETTAVVPCETFKALRKGPAGYRKLHCDGTHALVNGNGFEKRFAVLEGSFPKSVVLLDAAPDADSADVILGINAVLLATLAAGMGVEAVVLRIRTTDPGSREYVKTVVSVVPLDRDDAPVPNAHGLIMPIDVKP